MRPTADGADVDAVITALAARQEGVVSRSQLLAAGIPGHLIDYRLRRNRLRAIHSGVYGVGPVLPPHAREMAALLACGGGSLLCHRTAAAHWHLLPARRGTPRVDVCVTRDRRIQRRGIRVHRLGPLPSDEMTRHRDLPVTTPARTLLDLARSVADRTLERAVALADRAGLADRDAVQRLVERYPRRPGAGRLRALLQRVEGPAFTRSEAEERLLELVRKARLPVPETNVLVGGIEVDFLWPGEGLVVEMDGFAHHASRASFEWDRERDAELIAVGMTVLRVTWRQLSSEPEVVLVRLARALRTGGPGSGRRGGRRDGRERHGLRRP